MPGTFEGLRRWGDIAIARDGDEFIVISGYSPTEGGGYSCTHEYRTTNAREAFVRYAGDIASRIIREGMAWMHDNGYHPIHGTKIK